jgi:cellulose biosynthesis protein BcsQ
MLDVSNIKISEMQKYVKMSKPGISKHFKSLGLGVIKNNNNRIIGITPDASCDFISKNSNFKFNSPSITLTGNLCGGVGKTSSVYNLASAIRRVIKSNSPIVLIDGDSQASLTRIVCGDVASNEEETLIDFFEKKTPIKKLLKNIGDNTYLIKSNLNSAFLDKIINRPSDVKKAMKSLYTSIYDELGGDVKIFQDHTPQLSNLFASSISALNLMPDNIIKNVMIPIRSDDFALQGAKYIISEINEIIDTYNYPRDNIKIHAFFSALDRRISSTGEALKRAMSDNIIKDYLCPIVIRYSSEIPKSILHSENIFSSGRSTNATDDYQDLLQYIFS